MCITRLSHERFRAFAQNPGILEKVLSWGAIRTAPDHWLANPVEKIVSFMRFFLWRVLPSSLFPLPQLAQFLATAYPPGRRAGWADSDKVHYGMAAHCLAPARPIA